MTMTTEFLVLGLLFPRLTLVIAWILGGIPVNDTPLLADALGTVFVPRFLIAFWAYNAQVHPIWVILYVVLGLAEIGAFPANRSSRN
jgi:hypothetical protein